MKLSTLRDGTYKITEAHGVPVQEFRETGYWVGINPVKSISQIPEDEFLGVWTDSAGTRFYDATRHIEDLNEALATASYHDQIAIWDIKAGTEIPVI